MQLLFVHGAGGFVDDRDLASALGAELRAEVVMPRLPDDDLSFEAWASSVRSAMAALQPDAHVVAHSFGASILLRLLSETAPRRKPVALLAMPDWSERGWGVRDYLWDGPEPTTSVILHHCRDDEVVPFEHLALHAGRLPSADVYAHAHGGHQFSGQAPAVSASLAGHRR